MHTHFRSMILLTAKEQHEVATTKVDKFYHLFEIFQPFPPKLIFRTQPMASITTSRGAHQLKSRIMTAEMVINLSKDYYNGNYTCLDKPYLLFIVGITVSRGLLKQSFHLRDRS